MYNGDDMPKIGTKMLKKLDMKQVKMPNQAL
jgi:hypothetical protein